jgi:hypothetical protein
MKQLSCDECGAEREETFHAIAAGTIYRFCSEGCRRRFRLLRIGHLAPQDGGASGGRTRAVTPELRSGG